MRDIRSASVWARDEDKARECAAELSRSLGIPVKAAASVDAALEGADIAITTTPSREPLIQRRHLHPGLHITAMGSDAEHKNEIAAEALVAVDRYVADRLSQTRVLGELHHAIAAGRVAPDASFPELGQVIAGQQPGRRSARDITLCDLTGTGAQDTAIAGLAYQRAQRMGKGFTFHS
ncbi:ectoine utilization protein EutC [compost metagenome]